MRIFDKKKHSGGYRRIYAPNQEEKTELRQVLSGINQNRSELSAAHGFRSSRGVVTNAMPHIGAEVTISMDLKDFFDTVTLEMAKKRITSEVYNVENCFLSRNGRPEGDDKDRSARQGLPTSPAIANICASPLDAAIIKSLKKLGYTKVNTAGKSEPNADSPAEYDTYAAYTRYADDLSISLFKDPGQETIQKIISKVTDAAVRCGFRINHHKIRVQRDTGGRREICGVLVDSLGMYPRRDLRRKLRAALHNVALAGNSRADKAQARRCKGLFEFAQLRVPKTPEEKALELTTQKESILQREWSDAEKMAHADSNARIDRKWHKEKTINPQILGNSCKVSISPVDFLNMGQVHYPGERKMSCVSRGGAYHTGIPFWMACPGVALGLMDGTGTIEFAGVKRPNIKARTLLFDLRNGSKVFTRIYGDTENDCQILKRELLAVGFIPCTQSSGAVKGYIDMNIHVGYFDNGSVANAKMKDGSTKNKIVF